MVSPAHPQRPATLADLEALPPHLKGELIDGVLYAMPRPRPRQQAVAVALTSELYTRWTRGLGGPGGWWIIPEPGLSLPGADEISPDIAGWQKHRMPRIPADGPFTLVPDWVCEILSPSTRRHDQLVKLPYYAKVGVRWCWLVDLDGRVLTCLENVAGAWQIHRAFGDQADAHIEPFAAAALDLGAWWAELEASPPEAP